MYLYGEIRRLYDYYFLFLVKLNLSQEIFLQRFEKIFVNEYYDLKYQFQGFLFLFLQGEYFLLVQVFDLVKFVWLFFDYYLDGQELYSVCYFKIYEFYFNLNFEFLQIYIVVLEYFYQLKLLYIGYVF